MPASWTLSGWRDRTRAPVPSRHLGAGPNDPAPQLKDRGPSGSLFLTAACPPLGLRYIGWRDPHFLGLIDIGWREMRRTDDYDVDIIAEVVFSAPVITDDTRKELT